MTKKVSAISVLVAAAAMMGGCTPKTAQLAAVLPLTGDASLYGESIRKGIELAMDEVALDESLPVELTMSFADTGSDPAQAAVALQQAYGEAIAAIGGVTSAEALAMVPIAESAGKVLVSPTASSPELSGISNQFFRIFPNSETEAISMASHLGEVARMVIVAQDDAYGQGAAKALTNVFKGEVLATIPITSDSGLDAAVQQVREARAQAVTDKVGLAVYVAAAGNVLVETIRGLRRGGYADNLYTSSALASPEVIEQLGPAAEKVFLTMTAFDTASPEEPVASFVAAYEAKFQEQPDYYAAHGYDATKVLVQAIKEGGATLPSDVRTGLRAIVDLQGVTGSLQFRESGDVQKFMRVYQVVDGRLRDHQEYIKDVERRIRARREELQEEMRRINAQIQNNS